MENSVATENDDHSNSSIAAMNRMTYEEYDICYSSKHCVVSRDRDVLELKMKNSIVLREKTINKHETKFAEMFPFYFIEPELE